MAEWVTAHGERLPRPRPSKHSIETDVRIEGNEDVALFPSIICDLIRHIQKPHPILIKSLQIAGMLKA
jgi:hypothetical protein